MKEKKEEIDIYPVYYLNKETNELVLDGYARALKMGDIPISKDLIDLNNNNIKKLNLKKL